MIAVILGFLAIIFCIVVWFNGYYVGWIRGFNEGINLKEGKDEDNNAGNSAEHN